MVAMMCIHMKRVSFSQGRAHSAAANRLNSSIAISKQEWQFMMNWNLIVVSHEHIEEAIVGRPFKHSFHCCYKLLSHNMHVCCCCMGVAQSAMEHRETLRNHLRHLDPRQNIRSKPAVKTNDVVVEDPNPPLYEYGYPTLHHSCYLQVLRPHVFSEIIIISYPNLCHRP